MPHQGKEDEQVKDEETQQKQSVTKKEKKLMRMQLKDSAPNRES